MSDERNSDVTPESLMEKFKGPGLVKMVILTVVVHVVVIVGSSIPHLIKTVTRGDISKMSKEDRIKAAVEDASVVLRKIAEDHELNPQDISDQFASGGSRTAKAAGDGSADGNASKPENEPEPKTDEAERPKSAIEKKIETKVEGPKLPAFDDKKDDIF